MLEFGSFFRHDFGPRDGSFLSFYRTDIEAPASHFPAETLPVATTFSFALRAIEANHRPRFIGVFANQSAQLAGNSRANPFLLDRFIGDRENPLLECFCSEQSAENLEATPSFWPVVFYGPSGVGKTAMAETLASRLIGRKNETANFRKIVGSDFRRAFLDAVATRSTHEFRRQIHLWDVILLDQLESIGNDQAVLRELAQLVDRLVEQQKYLLVTVNQSPARLAKLPAGLRSRLCSGLLLEVKPPGHPARQAICKRLIDQFDLTIDPADLAWLVKTLPDRVPLIQRDITRIAVATSATPRQRLDRDLISSLLQKQNKSDLKRWLDSLITLVARHFHVQKIQLTGAKRKTDLVRARSAVIFLAREELSATFREIGQVLGRRDPSTIRHAYQQTKSRVQQDVLLAESIKQLAYDFQRIRNQTKT